MKEKFPQAGYSLGGWGDTISASISLMAIPCGTPTEAKNWSEEDFSGPACSQ